ncbi:phosphotransferase enzyme family protein [Melanomma pulvis-pyrius CBS 109.77]|uniref:Phosphotransferase enzyme family protein n=1 Tax=Melanomma pulvis-pyrius CBS 109.77 TaxID=1314802 RepID=A0A6A6WP07_9PLEO|nr:phosphotransferase enzyme family protein [Melanomma pulvis-pyrius CBS 109.77]
MAALPRAPSAEFLDASQTQTAFLDSTWFKTHGLKYSLPSPDQVRARCPRSGPAYSRPIARFEEFDLAVKFGDRVTTSEALCLRMVKRLLPTQVPVPEVYGWKVEQGQVFLYMQLIRGPTLLEQWGSMNYQDKQSVCSHLCQILQSLRTIPQNLSKKFVGPFLGGRSNDRVLEFKPSNGPWPSVASFHNWLSWVWRRHAPEPEKIADPFRQLLKDDSGIVLTHGDLHQSNIIVSETSPVYVLAIVDWEQSGWYPDYWEHCKTTYTVAEWDDWFSGGWIDLILPPNPTAQEAFDFYTKALGP